MPVIYSKGQSTQPPHPDARQSHNTILSSPSSSSPLLSASSIRLCVLLLFLLLVLFSFVPSARWRIISRGVSMETQSQSQLGRSHSQKSQKQRYGEADQKVKQNTKQKDGGAEKHSSSSSWSPLPERKQWAPVHHSSHSMSTGMGMGGARGMEFPPLPIPTIAPDGDTFPVNYSPVDAVPFPQNPQSVPAAGEGQSFPGDGKSVPDARPGDGEPVLAEGKPPRRRSYTKMVDGMTMGIEVSEEIIVAAEGWRRHTRVYGGGVCLACLESESEQLQSERLPAERLQEGQQQSPVVMGA